MSMAKTFSVTVICILIIQAFLFTAADAKGESERTRHEIDITIKTSHGTISLELYPHDAPITVENLLKYVNDGFYDGLIFHRVKKEQDPYMIQGGGFYPGMEKKEPTYPPIINEASISKMRNVRGTIAMARTGEPDSATSQFYINHKDNDYLDWDKCNDGVGYCVFGNVISGMDVVDEIASVEVDGEQPVNDVIITEVTSNIEDQDSNCDDDDNNGGNGGNGGYNLDKKPSNPRSVQIEAGDGVIEISWSKPFDIGAPPIYEYNIYRATSPGTERQLASVDATERSYKDTTVENGQIYYYYVIAVNAYAESDPSIEVSETPQKLAEQSPGFGIISLLGITVVMVVCLMRKKR